jgi:hypothetical protein
MIRNCSTLLLLTSVIFHLASIEAAPVITSPPPANGTSPSGPIVFTFSEPMDTSATEVTFVLFSPPFDTLPTTSVWSSGDTVLTCTPTPVFPSNAQLVWSASGQNPNGDALAGTPGGLFTTGGGGGGGGSGTNAITTFSVGKTHHYNQTSAGSPTLDPSTPYDFSGVTSLSSNRTATNVTLALPTGSVSNLTQLPPPAAEIFILYASRTDLGTYDAAFPAGNYTFVVRSDSSNQTAVVNLPTTNTMPQPGAPHLTNFAAAQAVNPNQPFVLAWDAFPGGTTADYIDVDIGSGYGSPNPGLPGALNGTARTFTVPAGTLLPNANYASRIGFFRFTGATNANFSTNAFRATYTEFSLITTATNSNPSLVLTNANWASGLFSFDVLCTTGQIFTVEYTNALRAGAWTKLLTTNSPGSRVHIVSPQAISNSSLLYRARNGS